jgi:hypothetical protein
MTAVERLIAQAVEQGHREHLDDRDVLARVALIVRGTDRQEVTAGGPTAA